MSEAFLVDVSIFHAFVHALNPFKPNEFSHCYQLDKSISIFKGCWAFFFVLFKF